MCSVHQEKMQTCDYSTSTFFTCNSFKQPYIVEPTPSYTYLGTPAYGGGPPFQLATLPGFQVNRIPKANLVNMNSELLVVFRTHFFRRALFGETISSRHAKSSRTHRSRSGRDPCNMAWQLVHMADHITASYFIADCDRSLDNAATTPSLT